MDGLSIATTLIRSTLRQFYETRHVLVVEALIRHSAIRDDDLAFLLGMQVKELHKLCGKLREDRWLAVHSRSETKEGNTRPVNRTYYYIDYRATVDMIKYKILKISTAVQGSTIPEQDRMEFFCNRCKSEYTSLDVAGLVPTREGMECEKCGEIVVENPNSNLGGHVQSTAWTSQISYIMEHLQKIDTVVIPPNPFEKAYEAALPVKRPDTNPGSETAPMETTLNRPTAVKGLKDTGPKQIAITLTTTNGPSAAEIAADAAKKAALATANALPEHFMKSSVSGDPHRIAKEQQFNSLPSISQTQDEKKPAVSSTKPSDDGDELARYFQDVAKQQAEEARKEAEEEFETDEEDEFEDVMPNNGGNAGNGGSAVGTPASSNGIGSPNKGLQPLAGILKKSKSREGSQSNSGTSTGVTSPTGMGTPEGERAFKRVRIEEAVKVKEEVDSDEDMEFEDV